MTATSRCDPEPRRTNARGSVGHRRASLLDLDSDLGRLLDDDRRPVARRHLTAQVLTIPTGQWHVGEHQDADLLHVGLLVVDGVLAREIALEDSVSTELLGPGDLMRPWQVEGTVDLLPAAIRWNALARIRLAILDRRLAAALAQWPEVNAVLFERLYARAQRLAITQAISQLNGVDRRLNALFWHLAERFGRVTPDGVVIPLALSHRLIGQLIGARRPTVSTALAGLADEHRLVRRQDGSWLLTAPPDDTKQPDHEVVLQRRRLVTRDVEPDITATPLSASAGLTEPRRSSAPRRSDAQLFSLKDTDSLLAQVCIAQQANADQRRQLRDLREQLADARRRLSAARERTIAGPQRDQPLAAG